MENKDIHFDDATIKIIQSKLNESYHSESYDDTMESLMRRMCMYEQKTSTETTNSDESQQYVNDINKQIVKEVEKQYNIRQYHEKYNIPYPMSEVKRKRNKLKRKKLKKLNRK